jgi:hypothetical protein
MSHKERISFQIEEVERAKRKGIVVRGKAKFIATDFLGYFKINKKETTE